MERRAKDSAKLSGHQKQITLLQNVPV